MALTTNLVSYWKLDGNSNDATGNGNNGGAGGTYSLANGKINQGVGLDGATSIQVTRNSAMNGFTAVSIAAWVKTSSTAASNCVAASGTYDSGTYHWAWTFGTSAGYVYLQIYPTDGVSTGQTQYTDTTTLVNNGAWHHVVAVWTASTDVKIYVDGTLVKTFTTSIVSSMASNSYTNAIGSDNNTQFAKNYYTGDLDEVGLWSRELSATEVSQLYNGGAGLTYPFTSTANPAFLLKFV